MRDGRSLRVALLAPCFWPEVRRGTERFVRDLADGLLARGHRPRLITSHQGRPRRTMEDGLEIVRLPRPPHGPLLRRSFEPYVTHLPLSCAALATARADVVHAVYPPDGLVAAAWHRRTGRPAVLSYMGVPEPAWLAQRHRREVLATALRGCMPVVLSQHAALAFDRALHRTPAVIAPGVDLDAFTPGSRAPHPTIVCAAAVEDPRKHVGLLVEAFARIRRDHPDAELLLSRPRDREHRSHISATVPGIRWLDFDDRAALARAYASAWVSALPAPDEAFGLVLIEALACGTPVVGYRGGGIPEIIDRPQIGATITSLDAEALAGALRHGLRLAADPATAPRCRERARAFCTDQTTEAYLALYRSLGAR